MFPLPDKATVLLPFREAAPSNAPPLRVGVVLDRGRPSRWVDALLTFLRGMPGIDVRLLEYTGRRQAKSERPGWLMDRLYAASRARFDPFADADGDRTDAGVVGSVEEIRAAKCGVLIWFAGTADFSVEPGSLAECGAFTVRLGERNQLVPFWYEVANDCVTSTVTVFWHDSSFLDGHAVCTAETPTERGLYFTRNAEAPLVAAIRMLATLCLEIGQGGSGYREKLRGLPSEPVNGPAVPDHPSTFEVGRFIARKLARSARQRSTTRGKRPRWFLAARPNSGVGIWDPARLNLSGFKEVPSPPGSETMADPFLAECAGRTYLLFEEAPATSHRGRLGCIEVLADGAYSEMKVVLECGYHVSYPCVVPAGGEFFLLPEAAEAGRVDLYRFTRFPWEVELVSSLVEGLPLVDTTPIFLNGRWYFFTSTVEPFMETLLFSADRLDGAWHLHPASPVSRSVRNSRSAGNLWWKNGRLFRPTQDCSVRYGFAIQVNEVLRLTPDEFEERPVSHILPSWMPGLVGTHTWNETASFQVIDGLRSQ